MKWCLVWIATVGCWTSSKPAPATSSAAGGAAADDGDSIVAGPLPAGCMRMRKTFVSRCSGQPPDPGEPSNTPTTVCDNCLTSADCTDQPGGQCLQTGDQMCSGPAHLVCKYPDPACGGKICPERVVEPPP
jgi:hypothetical protein